MVATLLVAGCVGEGDPQCNMITVSLKVEIQSEVLNILIHLRIRKYLADLQKCGSGAASQLGQSRAIFFLSLPNFCIPIFITLLLLL